MPSDFDMLAQMGPAGAGDEGSYDPRYGQQLQQAMAPQMENFRQLGANLSVANEAAQKPLPPSSATFKNDGTVDLKGVPVQTYEAYQRDRQQLDQIRGSFAQEAERLRQREQQVREQSPWIQLATALAANMAQAKDLPGWVQAAGKTSAQLNPQPDEIRNQRLGVLGSEAQMAEKSAGLNIAQARTLEAAQERKITAAQHMETQRTASVEHALDNLSQSIGKGPGAFDGKAAAMILASAGATSSEIDVKLKQLQTLANNVGQAFQINRDDKLKAQKIADDRDKLMLAQLPALNTKNAEKSDAEKALEITAQSIAKGDLTPIRDISSMRSDQRLRLYARVKELNPDFSTAEMNRKIDTEKAFTTGKEGDALKSFDTFLQHAGEVTDTLKAVQLTNSKLMNKSLNWWRTNMKGTPELARLETSIEPVGKEFEKFLIGGSALYDDDRKQVQKLLNADQPISVVLATVNQMGKTAQDRFAAMNKRYSRVLGHDIENPFSLPAQVGASKIGITLPTGGESTSGPAAGAKDSGGLHNKVTPQKYPWEK